MRFLVARDARIKMLVATFDDADRPYAETWRAVAQAAETMGSTRPSYYLVRTIARTMRLQRQVRDELRRAVLRLLLLRIAPRQIAVRRAAEKLREARSREQLVLRQHMRPSARPPPD